MLGMGGLVLAENLLSVTISRKCFTMAGVRDSVLNKNKGKPEFSALRLADDANIFRKIKSKRDIEAMQEELSTGDLNSWSLFWLLDLNVNKCINIHIGHRDRHIAYDLKGIQLKVSNFGVHLSTDLKSSHLVNKVAARGSQLVGLTRRNFKDMVLETSRTYCDLVRSHLEYSVQHWSPWAYYQKDILELEEVLRWMTKLVPKFKDL